jgi:hypothetical protein
MYRSEFLDTSHPRETKHGPFALPEGVVFFGSVVVPSFEFAPIDQFNSLSVAP